MIAGTLEFFAFETRGACAPGRTKSLETVATRVVTCISHCIVLFCERYWLAGVWCLCYVWWHTLFLINCFGIELVVCRRSYLIFHLDSNKQHFFFFWWCAISSCISRSLFWQRVCNLTLYLLFFFTNSVVVIIEYLYSNHFQYQSICKPNKKLKSNGPWTKISNGKKCAVGKIFCKENAPQADPV